MIWFYLWRPITVNLVKAELQYLLVMRSKLAFSASQLPHLEYRYNIIIYEVMNINFLCLGSVAQCVWLFATPWTAALQASLSITSSQSLLRLMSIESVMPSNHLTLCRPLLLPPSIFPSIMVFSIESVPRIRWPKYWSFSFSISPSIEYSELISYRILCIVTLKYQ